MATAENIAKMKKAYPPYSYGGEPEDPDEFGYAQASDYGAMVELLPGEAIVNVDAGDYQGDTYVLLKDGNRYGYVTFGWGSCSGCDALQACSSFEEVADLFESIEGAVHWEPTADAMLNWWKAKDWEGTYVWHEAELKEFAAKVFEALEARKLKGEEWLDVELARLKDDDW